MIPQVSPYRKNQYLLSELHLTQWQPWQFSEIWPKMTIWFNHIILLETLILVHSYHWKAYQMCFFFKKGLKNYLVVGFCNRNCFVVANYELIRTQTRFDLLLLLCWIIDTHPYSSVVFQKLSSASHLHKYGIKLYNYVSPTSCNENKDLQWKIWGNWQ